MILGGPTESVPSPPRKCSKCGADMEEGFVVDHLRRVSTWVAGKPEYGILGGAKIRDKSPIQTFCCSKCGYLESYVSRT
jgi:ribosomal protein S27AE